VPETEKFEHFQVLRRPDGSLWELGRGAMGVTYKAFDTNLRCDVALKVINPQFLNSETARQRFLREARAASRIGCHPRQREGLTGRLLATQERQGRKASCK